MKDKFLKIITSPIFALIMMLLISLLIDYYNSVQLKQDPEFGINLNGDTPQIVYQVKIGDDVRPHVYQTWYNPKTGGYSDFIVEVE